MKIKKEMKTKKEMKNKKIAKLSETLLFQLGSAGKAQQYQLSAVESTCSQIGEHQDCLDTKIDEALKREDQIQDQLEVLIRELEEKKLNQQELNAMLSILEDYKKESKTDVERTSCNIMNVEKIHTDGCWENYINNVAKFEKKMHLDSNQDPFLSMLSQGEYIRLDDEINGEFQRKTGIKNDLDIKFLAIATALTVAKGIIFPLVAEKLEYGKGFNPDKRMAHNDKRIEEEARRAKKKFQEDHKNTKNGRWTEILYQTPPYDITRGTGKMSDVNLHGGDHRLYTLGHDPILGWLFGTSNILTDTISITPGAIQETSEKTMADKIIKAVKMRTYRVSRNPMMVTQEEIALPSLFLESMDISKEHYLNLPAAVFAEAVHLKSDVLTKKGLPVPVLSMFNPELASKLYSENYDFLCSLRDVKILGTSLVLSKFIDMIISLIHGLYYDEKNDGSRDLFEVRTRKILLIANTIGSTSNLVVSALARNPRGVDIGGLLVTLSHLFLDPQFICNIKREFVEDKLSSKIENEIEELESIEMKLCKLL